MKIQKLSNETHQRVLGRDSYDMTAKATRDIQNNLEPAGLQNAEDTTPHVELPLPSWLGTWQEMANVAVQRYGSKHFGRLTQMVNWQTPKVVSIEYIRPGWQYWSGTEWVKCTPPSGRAMVLDFETVEVSEDNWQPVCAVARIEKTWLLWCCDIENMQSLVPFGTGNTVVGHNIPYDRQWLQNEYQYKDTGNRFSDTMSMHIVTRGLSNQQRPTYLATEGGERPMWVGESCTNGLDALYEFHFGKQLNKGVRSLVIKQGMPYVRDNLADILKYCMMDVLATLELFQTVYPEYLRHRPSEVSQTAALLLGSSWVPLSAERYPDYYMQAEATYKTTMAVVKAELVRQCEAYKDNILEKFPFPDEYFRKSDVTDRTQAYEKWLAQLPQQAQCLDWTPALTGKTKGEPFWYRKLDLDDVSLGKRVIPVVLQVKWRGYPVLWNTVDKVWYTNEIGVIPHPEDPQKGMVNLFIKGMAHAVEEGVMTAEGDLTDLLARAMSVINWVSMRKRVAAIHSEEVQGYPVVLPQLTVNGTITGRAADNLWQVLANPKPKRIGTELKSMVEAPQGYRIVGADVDSQELWLDSLLGDKVIGYCGSTPLGLMVLIGDKAAKTDVHSKVAEQSNIARDYAKNLVYGAVYGLGVAGATNTLAKNLPGSSYEECKAKAATFLNVFKGVKSPLSKRYIGGLASDSFTEKEVIADDKQPRTPLFKNLLTKSLTGHKDYKTTKVNWVIQSSGVDFRDLLILLQRLFYDFLSIDGRFMLSVHDEVRTIVNEAYIEQAIYALQLAHLCCRAAFIDALALDCIPSSVAWFSEVDVDTVFRKSVNDPCVTPSSLTPIPPGKSYTPQDILNFEWLKKADICYTG